MCTRSAHAEKSLRREELPSHRLNYQALPDRPPALAHGEAHALLDRGGGDKLAVDRHVIARHRHLHLISLRAGHSIDLARDVACPEVEDRHVARHDGVRTAALVLLREVDVGLELGVGGGRTGRADHLPAKNGAAIDAAAQDTHGVARRALWKVRVEHADARDDGLLGLLATAEDLHLVALLDDALLHAARGDGAASGDGEDVLHGQQERLVGVAGRQVDVLVHDLHELQDLVAPLVVALLDAGVRLHGLQRLQRGTHDEGGVITWEAVLAEHLPCLQLHELEQLLVIHHIDFVHEADELRHANLLGEEDVLTRLRHGPVGGGDHENATVHLAGARNHVLDVIGMARAVHVAVVAALSLVLNVRSVDRDTAGALLRRVVDLLVGLLLRVLGGAELPADEGDRGRERGLAVVNVADRADVDMVLGTSHDGCGARCRSSRPGCTAGSAEGEGGTSCKGQGAK
mmetsp:Transcript_51862/g.160674  ORF Transcript_51862/g.160674 Transcript_51862/m.160674 type:complete len:460 (-) Transcript_51862:273-1652(-)